MLCGCFGRNLFVPGLTEITSFWQSLQFCGILLLSSRLSSEDEMWFRWSLRIIIIAVVGVYQIPLSSAHRQPINVVVVVDSSSQLFLPAISKALNESSFIPEIKVENVKELVIEDSSSENEVCQQIIDPSMPPSLLIDATLRPQDTGNKASSMVKMVARKMGIPTISVTYGSGESVYGGTNLNDIEKELLVHIPPPGEVIPYVIRDIVIAQNMSTTGILYDSSFVMDHQYSAILENIPTRHIMRYLGTTPESISETTTNVASVDVPNMFVLGTLKTIKKVISVAKKSKNKRGHYAWFFISKETGKLSAKCKSFTMMLLRPQDMMNDDKLIKELKAIVPSEPEVDSAFYYDIAQLGLLGISRSIREKAWPESLTYPSCGEDLDLEKNAQRSVIKFASALKQLSHDGLFGRFIVQENGQNFQEIALTMHQMKWVNNTLKPPLDVGIWNYGKPRGEIMFKAGQSMDDMKAKKVYQITTLIQPPFITKRVIKEGNSTRTVFEGYCIDLINEIKEIMNFDYVITETEDGVFGSMKEVDGKPVWNGLIRDLQMGKADIALAPLSVMAERETVVDFTVPYYDLVGIQILMKKPKVSSSLFKFLTVLENNVWGCILAAYFFTSFLLYLFDRLSPYSFHNNKEKLKDETEKREFNIKESLWFCMTSLTPQGGGEAPRNLSGRLVAATWWLFGFIIIASYTANLAAFLTVSRLDSPIESLDDLAKQYKIKYAPVAGTSAMTYFERMAYIEERFYQIWKRMSLDDKLNDTERAKLAVWDYPVSDKFTKIWWSMNEAKMPETFEEGRDRVKASEGTQSGFALFADSTQVRYATMTNCDLQAVGNEFSRKPLALAVQQNSTLKDELSSAILKLLNQRKLEALKERWWNKNPDKLQCDEHEKQSDGISIANIGGVFIVIFIGVLLACVTLAIEYWYYKKKRGPGSSVVAVKEYDIPPATLTSHHPMKSTLSLGQ